MDLAQRIIDRGPTRDYDADAAYLCAVLSTWSYADQEPLGWIVARESISGARAPVVKRYGVKNPVLPVDADGYLISFGNDWRTAPLHVLAFRGTEPTTSIDFLTDALVDRHVWARGTGEWVHRGFYLSLDVIWPRIAADLAQIDAGARLLVTGHSLGGAIATLAGRAIVDAQRRTEQKGQAPGEPGPTLGLSGVYTFGQPMAGNERFARRSEELGLPLFRHVYGQDVVPHLPPRDVDPEYRHFGSRYAADRGRSRWAREDGTADQAELADIAPALLTLLTVRMPTLEGRHPLELLRVLLEPFVPCVNRVPPLKVISRMLGWVLSNCSWAPKYSVDDHVPTHYVDVCGGSLERPHVELVR